MKPTAKDSSWQMSLPAFSTTPKHASYDVVIIGGATMGACTAWFLASNPDFKGKVLIVEKDPTFEKAQTGASNNCMSVFATVMMAETKGFEPSRRFPVYSLSRGAPSTTRPRLRRPV